MTELVAGILKRDMFTKHCPAIRETKVRNSDVDCCYSECEEPIREQKSVDGTTNTKAKQDGEINPLNYGTGLGLWFVKQIVRGSNGALLFDTNDMRGTSVIVRLPES